MASTATTSTAPNGSSSAGAAATGPLQPTPTSGQAPNGHVDIPNLDHLGNPKSVMLVAGKRPYVTPKIMLKELGDKISAFESSEVLDYPEIYYFGYGASKVKGMPWAPNNHGYDDVQGDLKLVRHDHLAYRYKLIEKVGKGSFGQVVRAYDYKTGEPVAIKVIRNKKRFFQQALTEVRLLEHIRKKDPTDKSYIVRMFSHFVFRSHLCIVFELLGHNLYESIKKNNFRGFAPEIVKHISLQMLHCLDLLHKENIIHCDLKPENILLRFPRRSSVKVIDFGSSCFSNETVHTYIQSRFYRSPEVVLGLPYTTSIDIWSFACIVAELVTGFPLFAANNEVDLMGSIIQVIGPPPKAFIQSASRVKQFFDENHAPKPNYDSKGNLRTPNSRPLSSVLNRNDPHLLDLLLSCLQWEPSKRLTPQQALQHPWFANAACPVEGFSLDTGDAGTSVSVSASSSQALLSMFGNAAVPMDADLAPTGVSATMAPPTGAEEAGHTEKPELAPKGPAN